MSSPIRHARRDDAAAIQAIFSCPSVIQQTLQLPYPSVGAWQQRLESNDALSHHLVYCDDNDRAVAIASLTRAGNARRAHCGALSLAVHDAHQGQGLGRQLLLALLDLADNWLGLIRLELNVYADNARAIALYEKLGFRSECRLLRDTLRNGRYEDGLLMARLRWPQGGAA